MFHHELLLRVDCYCFKQALFHLDSTELPKVSKKGCVGANWAHHIIVPLCSPGRLRESGYERLAMKPQQETGTRNGLRVQVQFATEPLDSTGQSSVCVIATLTLT